MTNFEKYKNEIMKIVTENCCSPAKKDGVIIACAGLDCKECDFGDASKCRKNYFKWLCEDDGEEPDRCNDGEEPDRCNDCKYKYKREDESPCVECYHNYTSKFERRLKKTRQDEFLERYPNVRKCNGVIDICPGELDIYHYCRTQGPFGEGCITCCQDYWLQEVEE